MKITDARGPPVGLLIPAPGPTCRRPVSTWCLGRVASSTRLLPPTALVGIQLGPTALVRRTPPEVLSEILRPCRLARAAGERVIVAIVELDRQADVVVALHGELLSTLCMLRFLVASPTSLPRAGSSSPYQRRACTEIRSKPTSLSFPFGRERLHVGHLRRSPSGAASASMSFSRSLCASPAA
jgi:hypothetical protein